MKKKLLSLLCVVLLVVGAVVGTYAYLTDSDTVNNTFTVGKVGLDLNEAKTNEYGVAQGTERTESGNKYKLIPGHTYVKDPTVTVDADSEDSYIRMIVTVENISALKNAIPKDDVEENGKVVEGHPEYYADDVFLLEKLCSGWDKKIWTFVNDPVKNADGVYEFRYHEVVNTLSDTNGDKLPDARTLEALFTDITVPSFLEKDGIEALANVQIKVVAHAIQKDGFADADAAWANFKA